MANTIIQLKHSTVTGNVPASLANGEISINSRDGKLFYSTPLGVVTAFNPYPGPSGLDTELQFNDGGSLGGSEKLTFNKTTGLLTVNGTVRANIFSDDGIDIFNFANNAYNTANSKTYIFEQNTAPTTSNVADRWVNIDTGFEYHNFGNTTHPVWAEVGPTGVLPNTEPGVVTGTIVYSDGVNLLQFSNAAFNKANTAITTSGGSITGQLNVTYQPATTVGAAFYIYTANTRGGTSYADFLSVTNTSGGATNPSKWFRVNSGGGLEIINSGYTATLLTLTDAGALSVGSTVSSTGFNVNNKQAVNGPAFRAYIDSGQSITSGSQQKVTFGGETFDTNNNFSSSRFTPTVEGYYQLNATVRISGTSGTGEIMITIWKNGSEYARGVNESGTEQGSGWYSMQVSDIAYANGTGDYFEIYIQQTTGGNRDTTAGTNISYFSGAMVRGA